MASHDEDIPITRPLLGEAEVAATADPIRSGWVAQGPQVAAFETELASALGSPHACAVSSGTAALHLALRAVGVGPGDRVVTVSHSFIATANAVRFCGAEPVFVDVEPRLFNADPGALRAALKQPVAAVLAVHQMGMPCDLEAVLSLAAERDVPVVEDAACALGSRIRWRGEWQPIGRPQAQVACFSFHPRKVLTTGEGGLITTADPALDARVRRWRDQGADRSSGSYPDVGYNYRMTDIQAAIGRQQLRRLPEIVAARRRLAGRYRDRLGAIEGLVPPVEPEWAESNWQSYCVRLPAGTEQAGVIRHLSERGIATQPGIMNSHEQPAYADYIAVGSLGESERAHTECLLLPLFPQLTDAQQDRVIDSLAAAIRD